MHMPYRGSAPAMQDLPAGQLQMIVDNIPGALTQARAAKVRAIAVTWEQRSPIAPEIPAMSETLPGFDVVSWTTLSGPAKLPLAIVEKLSAWAKATANDPVLKAKFTDVSATPLWMSPADTLAYRDKEEKRLAPIIRASGARED